MSTFLLGSTLDFIVEPYVQNDMRGEKLMETEKQQVALASVAAAVLLTTFKLVVGIMTGSLGILAEALHSGLDLIAAVITCIAVHFSDQPADRQYHYGHGKIENLSALIETILLLITCVWIIYEAMGRLSTGKTHIEVGFWSYAVVITSMIVDWTRSRALLRVAHQHNSQALEADALHFSTDIWSSGVVLLGLIGSQFGFYVADPIAALGVSILILFVSFRLGKKAVDILLDKAPGGIAEDVIRVLHEFPEVKHFHSLKIRTAGADTFVKVNLHLDPMLRLAEVHKICDQIEKRLSERIPRCETYLHTEPEEKRDTTMTEEEDDL
ncbi:MAG: cation diffusion facilitator family transporter [Thermoguttaceae bacterium]